MAQVANRTFCAACKFIRTCKRQPWLREACAGCEGGGCKGVHTGVPAGASAVGAAPVTRGGGSPENASLGMNVWTGKTRPLYGGPGMLAPAAGIEESAQ